MAGIKPRTVFNVENRAYKSKQYPPFLGEQLALHDTVNVMYPELEELYLLQRSKTWTENEINLQQSRMDMIHSRQEEIDIMVKVVSYLWEADSVASRSILPVFAPFITNSELNEMMTEQTRFEVIHGKTYSEIVRQCVTDPQKVLDETMKNDEILSRTDTIIQAFDEVIKYGALYSLGSEYTGEAIPKSKYMEVILKGIFALYLLERIQFMSSFSVVFGLAERDRFKGIADLVQLIFSDEALHSTMMSTLINILREYDDWNTVYESLIPDFEVMLDEVVEREFQWNKYLFSEGRTMVGLNTELLNDWVLYCTMDFCARINFKYPYRKITSNPLPWMDNWSDMNKIQNANQEADNINYRVNAMDNDLDDDEIFDI